MVVTKQVVRPLPGGKKVKQFNDIKKHQLTFLTCNDCFFFCFCFFVFTKHCNFSEYGANVNAEQHGGCVLNSSIHERNRVRLVRTDGTVTTVNSISAG